jgi:hypothetical protein
VLVALGLLLLAVGGFYLLADVPVDKYFGILIWSAGALVIHDGVIAPIVFGISLIMRRAGRRMPFGVLAIVQAALVIAAVFAAVVIPAALKKGIGTANGSLLPLDYGRNLVLFYVGLVVLTAVAIVGYLLVRRARARGGRATPAAAG